MNAGKKDVANAIQLFQVCFVPSPWAFPRFA